MGVELLYGMAGLVGSLVSGHLYPLLGSSLGSGTLLVVASMVLHVLSLLQASVLLRVSVATDIARACQLVLISNVIICGYSKRYAVALFWPFVTLASPPPLSFVYLVKV